MNMRCITNNMIFGFVPKWGDPDMACSISKMMIHHGMLGLSQDLPRKLCHDPDLKHTQFLSSSSPSLNPAWHPCPTLSPERCMYVFHVQSIFMHTYTYVCVLQSYVSSCIHLCLWCSVNNPQRARANQQPFGSLTPNYVHTSIPPFTNSWVDLFTHKC